MPAPSNDNFASAQVISGASGSVPGSTFDATMEGTESTTIGTGVQSVWYEFTAPSTGWFKFSLPSHTYHGTLGGDPSTAQLRVFPNGVLTAMTQTNAIAGASSFSFDGNEIDGISCAAFLTSGSVYKIRVASFKSSGVTNTGTLDFDIAWEAIAVPANDTYAAAVDLGSVPISETGITNLDATFETSELAYEGGFYDSGQSVWYTFTPAVTGTYRFKIPGASYSYEGAANNPNAGLVTVEVGTGASAAAFTFTAGDTFAINANFIADVVKDIALTGGTTYYIRVLSPYQTKSGDWLQSYNSQVSSFDLEVNLVTPPANDAFANVEVLPATAPDSASGTTDGATTEAGESSVWSTDRSVWYKITPTTSGLYLFRIPNASIISSEAGQDDDGALALYIWPSSVTAVGDADSGVEIDNDFFYNDPTWSQYPRDGVVLADLVSGQTYYIKVLSPINSGNPNRFTAAFDLEYEIITPPSNDDFANRTVITGASGTEDFDAIGGSGPETDEPDSAYWNGGSDATLWFEWTCPATGDYKFKVECLDSSNTQANYDLAVWTGSTLATLVKVTRTWHNSKHNGVLPQPTAGVGFHGVSGTVYKIQVQAWSSKFGGSSRLTWATNTVTGDSTASPVSLPINALVDNYGNDASEPPPNFATLLNGHDEWWYSTFGAVGHVKWFKYTAAQDITIGLKAKFWDGDDPDADFNFPKGVSDIGLIAYKGADYASLTVAQTTAAQSSRNVAMLAGNGVFAHGDSQGRVMYIDASPVLTDLEIDVDAGENLWVCIFGLYRTNIGDAITDAEDAQQFQMDLEFTTAAPANDSPATTDTGYPTYTYALARSWYGTYLAFPDAAMMAGTTFGATADIGESANAGYGPTRTVWFELDIQESGDYKIWVESAGDCVLGVYEWEAPSPWVGAKIDEDDDSGPGNWPEVTVTLDETIGSYWVVVDSKTETTFTVKYQRVTTGTPPANDDFDDAEVISSFPAVISGTTVDATAQPEEKDSEALGLGPKDTVWYQYTATFSGQIKVKATCDTDNEDSYVVVDVWTGGPALEDLVRAQEPLDLDKGFFNHFDTPQEIDEQSLIVNVVNGEDYWIRVQTESGGSEDFTLYVDLDVVYLNLTAGGSEEFHGTIIDEATVYLDLTVSSSEDFHPALTTDAATVSVKLTPLATWETQGAETVDSATVYIDLTPGGHECYSTFSPQLLGEGEADLRFVSAGDELRFQGDADLRFSEGEIMIEGINC